MTGGSLPDCEVNVLVAVVVFVRLGKDPSITINTNHRLRFQFGNIAASKTGVAAEKKNATDLFEAFDSDLLFTN